MIKVLNSIDSPIPSDSLEIKIKPVLENLDIKGNITINIGSEAESQNLNYTYLKKEYPTDVLSFPINEHLPDGQYYLGDIFICNEIAKKQAEENGISHLDELLQLIIHGILHLLGYDHTQDHGEMHKLQSHLFDKIK